MASSPFTVEAPAGSPRLVGLLLLLARLAGAFVVLLGVAVLWGWSAGIGWLQDPIGSFVPMTPTVALLLVLAGLSLSLSIGAAPRKRWVAKVLAVLGAAISLTELAEEILRRDFGIDTLLVGAHPTRPAVATLAAVLLSYGALLALDVRPRRGPALAEVLAAGAATLAWLTIGGFAYGAAQFYSMARQPLKVGMAFHTAVALVVLATGTVLARPERGAMAVLTSRHVGGQAARRMLIVALTVPVVGYLAALAQRAGVYAPPGAAVVASVAAMVVAIVITLVVGASLDRTDARRRRAEEARSLLASLVQSSDDAIIVQALDGTVLDWNHGAERLYGHAAGEMIGHPIAAIVPEDRRAERAAIQQRALEGQAAMGIETERVRKDGRRISVSLTMSPIRDARGRVVAISTIGRDITLLKQLEREREEWGAIVAHDLRQPTATIHLVASALAQSEGEPARQKAIAHIRKASDRLERMIDDLLDVSRVATGHVAVEPETVSLQPLIAEVIELLPEGAGRCRTTIAPDSARARADSGRVVQVLSNLLSNAVKYGDPGTPVDVGVELAGGMVRVSVTNEGPGIPPDELPTLFSRFARTSSAQSGGWPGLGLGLYISRGIVEALGGTLWAESVPGERTHFRFTLPAAP